MKKLADAKYPIGMLVSSHPISGAKYFMPGVGKIVAISIYKGNILYTCIHNGIAYQFTEEQIYEYDPY